LECYTGKIIGLGAFQFKDFENYNLQFHGLGDFFRPAQVHSIALIDYETYSFFNTKFRSEYTTITLERNENHKAIL
jgi:hypothetical protein